MDKTTEDLTNEINSISSEEKLTSFLQNNAKEQSLDPISYLFNTIAAKNIRECDFRKNTQLDSSRLSHILNGDRPISREICLVCAIAGNFTPSEANYLLKYSGNKPLYIRDPRDSVIYFGLQKKYSLTRINLIMADLGLAIIPKPKIKSRD